MEKNQSLLHNLAKDPQAGGSSDTLLEQYQYYYDRIYPLLKEGRLDFHRIAEKANLKERRVRETLLFRLGSGEVMQLFGGKDGYCFTCDCRIQSAAIKEPLCIGCLRLIDKVIQETSASVQEKTPMPQDPANKVPFMETASLMEETVPRALYEQALQELERYRERYGPIPQVESQDFLPSIPPDEETDAESRAVDPVLEDSTETKHPDEPEQSELTLSFPDDDPFFEMLALEDEKVIAEISEAFLFSKDPIRHFGFQRMKGGTE